MTLKTLKDFERKINDRTQGAVHFVDSKRLRAEAIKWVKEFRSNTPKGEYEWVIQRACGNPEAWIIHFFNLSEEDIK